MSFREAGEAVCAVLNEQGNAQIDPASDMNDPEILCERIEATFEWLE